MTLGHPIGLPKDVQAQIVHWHGSKGRRWIEDLPRLVGRLTAEWQLTIGRTYGGGSHALVTEARLADGSTAVLKVPYIDVENREEPDALRLYGGDGAVQLLRVDGSGAMLLERLEPGTPLHDHPDADEALDIACRLLRRLRRPPGVRHPFDLVLDEARRWAAQVEGVAQTIPAELVDAARRAASELLTPVGEEVLVNRDAHLENILAAQREPWLLIDPKPLVGEAAFDAGFLLIDRLRGDPTPAAAAALIPRLAKGLGVPARRVRDWGLLRSVVNAAWSLGLGGDPVRSLSWARAIISAGTP